MAGSIIAHLVLLVLITGIARPSFNPPKPKREPVVMVSLASLPAPEPGTTTRVKPHSGPSVKPAPPITPPKVEEKKPALEKKPIEKPKETKQEKPKPEAAKTSTNSKDDKPKTHERNAPENAPDRPAKAGSADTLKVPKSDLPHVGNATGDISIKVDGPMDPFSYYLQLVQQKISREWDPPTDLRSGSDGITASVRFRIQRDGTVPPASISVEEPSGNYLFDRAMLQALTAAGTLPPLPSDYAAQDLGLEITFVYHP
ncbi:MAG: TonB family protein [Candidatus Eisenbacteria bacterium]